MGLVAVGASPKPACPCKFPDLVLFSHPAETPFISQRNWLEEKIWQITGKAI